MLTLHRAAGFTSRAGQLSSNVRQHKAHPVSLRLTLNMMYAIKTEVTDLSAASWDFEAQKTMYGGKNIAVSDKVFVFASTTDGGAGLLAAGTVTAAKATPKRVGIERQTPRVSINVNRMSSAKRRLGRTELKPYSEWNDGRPETELNFKLYRQATNKIVGLSAEAAAFLRSHFE